HAAALLLRNEPDGNAVVLEDRHEILIEQRLVAIAVAGGKEGDSAGGLLGRAHGGAGAIGRRAALIRNAQPGKSFGPYGNGKSEWARRGPLRASSPAARA